jgi:HK97 family phage prohead protease
MQKFLHINTKTFTDYGVENHRDLWNKVKGEYSGLSTEVITSFTKSEDKPSRYKVVFSTDDVDRHGDVVKQNFVLTHFKKNPVLLDSHNYGSIEHILGRVAKISAKGNLHGEVEFADMNPKGRLAQAMADAGFINATSIGFIPLDFDDKGNITKSELLEISLVSVPANAYALFEKTIEEVKEIEKTVTPETPEPEVIETAVELNRRKFLLGELAKSIQDMKAENLAEKKRKVLKALRTLA